MCFYPLERAHVYLHVTKLAVFGEKVCRARTVSLPGDNTREWLGQENWQGQQSRCLRCVGTEAFSCCTHRRWKDSLPGAATCLVKWCVSWEGPECKALVEFQWSPAGLWGNRRGEREMPLALKMWFFFSSPFFSSPLLVVLWPSVLCIC